MDWLSRLASSGPSTRAERQDRTLADLPGGLVVQNALLCLRGPDSC